MFVRTFKVKGEDVNDFMVMQNFAYLEYSAKLLEVFLFEKGFSRLKLNRLKIGWQKTNDRLVNKKQLMFTDSFTVRLNFSDEKLNNLSRRMFVDFYDNKNELCASLITELTWFDYNLWQKIETPRKISQYFEPNHRLLRAV